MAKKLHSFRWLMVGFIVLAGSALHAEEPTWPPLGKIKPRAAAEVASSNWSIGCETLDRDFGIYANFKKHLGPLGAKAVRLQAGWAKCEKTPGVYNWQWLDEIVDDALAQGVQPWLETSYGNPIYPNGGDPKLGGGFPKTPEALAAWDKWVRALASHFKDRVYQWEVWNEPDNHPPEDYANLLIRTAEIIRAEQPKAQIYGIVLMKKFDAFAEPVLKHLKAKDKLHLMDAATVHGYPLNPDDTANIDQMRKLLKKYGSSASVRQGETGAPSATGGFGAMRTHVWSEHTQAKWNLRRMLAHRAIDAPFSLFPLMDLRYPTGWNHKGLLQANEDLTVAYAKPAYYAAQRIFGIFDDSMERIRDFQATTTAKEPLAASAYRKKGSAATVVAVWFNGQSCKESDATTPIDLTFPGVKFSDPVYADLLTGKVYAIPADCWSADGDTATFKQIPIYDSPILIAEKSVLPLDANVGQ
jgi:hypothetical protein